MRHVFTDNKCPQLLVFSKSYMGLPVDKTYFATYGIIVGFAGYSEWYFRLICVDFQGLSLAVVVLAVDNVVFDRF